MQGERRGEEGPSVTGWEGSRRRTRPMSAGCRELQGSSGERPGLGSTSHLATAMSLSRPTCVPPGCGILPATWLLESPSALLSVSSWVSVCLRHLIPPCPLGCPSSESHLCQLRRFLLQTPASIASHISVKHPPCTVHQGATGIWGRTILQLGAGAVRGSAGYLAASLAPDH